MKAVGMARSRAQLHETVAMTFPILTQHGRGIRQDWIAARQLSDNAMHISADLLMRLGSPAYLRAWRAGSPTRSRFRRGPQSPCHAGQPCGPSRSRQHALRVTGSCKVEEFAGGSIIRCECEVFMQDLCLQLWGSRCGIERRYSWGVCVIANVRNVPATRSLLRGFRRTT
jgi:hypothetical protein